MTRLSEGEALLMKPIGTLLLLPFSYPHYPREIVDAQVQEAVRLRIENPDLSASLCWSGATQRSSSTAGRRPSLTSELTSERPSSS